MGEHVSQARLGRGTLFQRGGLNPEDPFETCSDVISFGIPDDTPEEVDVTHSESPDGFLEFIKGFVDAGEGTVGLNWRPDLYPNHAALRSDKADGLRRYYRYVLPGGMETITVYGFIKNIKRNVTPKGAITADVTMRCSRVTSV